MSVHTILIIILLSYSIINTVRIYKLELKVEKLEVEGE